MISNRKHLEKYDRKLAQAENLPYSEKLALLDSVLKKAIAEGAFTEELEKESFEAKLKLAKALNSLK